MSDAENGNPAAAWSQGARKRQEDFCLYGYLERGQKESAILMVVADGMGGQNGGDVASRTACDAFAAKVRASTASDLQQLLRDSLDEANAAVLNKLEADQALAGMGTTLLGIIVKGDVAHWISVGDSILYLLRNSRLKRLNADHSLAGLYAERVSKGEITQEEADELGGHNQLRSAVMGEPLTLIDQSTAKTRLMLEPGDVLLLSSDGILTLDESLIEEVADRHRHSARALAEALIEDIHAARAPRQDNTTVIAYVYTGSAKGSSARGRWLGKREIGVALSGLALLALAGLGYALLYNLPAVMALIPEQRAGRADSIPPANANANSADATAAPSAQNGSSASGQQESANKAEESKAKESASEKYPKNSSE